MVQRHSPESKPFVYRVKAMQKLLPRFSSQKRLNSIAQETRQVTLRFPLSTAAKADITVALSQREREQRQLAQSTETSLRKGVSPLINVSAWYPWPQGGTHHGCYQALGT